MKLSSVLCSALIVVLGSTLAPIQLHAQKFEVGPDFTVPDQPEFVPGEVIVRFKPNTEAATTMEFELQGMDFSHRTSGGEVLYQVPGVRAAMPAGELGIATESAEAEARSATLEWVRKMSERPDVEYAEPNYLLYPVAQPNDPLYPNQWHYFVNGTGPSQSPGGIDLPPAWDTNTGNAGVVVAVIDTGILLNHADVAGSPNLAPGFDFITDPQRANDGDGRDSNATDTGDAVAANECGPGRPARSSSWHGSHVAGTVGVARTGNAVGIAGVNWSVRVVPLRVLGKCGGTVVDITDAIRWAAGLPVPGVATNPNPARVINMSLGGRGSCGTSFQRAIDDAVAANAAVVVAAGNEAEDASGHQPASCNGVITVAASDFRGHLAERYSNFGPAVEIMAPGGDVQRDDNGDGTPDGVLSLVSGGYALYNGTSMAAPHVAGVAALLVADTLSLTPAQILAELQQRARARDATNGCPPGRCGAGLLRVGVVASPPSVTISAPRVDLWRFFDTSEAVSVTVREGGQPKAGAQVSLRTDDAAIATVMPGAGATDASGQFAATVESQSGGETTLHAESGGATASAPIKVPGLPFALVAVAAAALLVTEARRARGDR